MSFSEDIPPSPVFSIDNSDHIDHFSSDGSGHTLRFPYYSTCHTDPGDSFSSDGGGDTLRFPYYSSCHTDPGDSFSSDGGGDPYPSSYECESYGNPPETAANDVDRPFDVISLSSDDQSKKENVTNHSEEAQDRYLNSQVSSSTLTSLSLKRKDWPSLSVESSEFIKLQPKAAHDSGIPSCSNINEDTQWPTRRKRKRTRSENCPVCGLTIQSNKLEQHFCAEVQKLDNAKKRKPPKSLQKGMSPRQMKLQKVRANRQERQAKSRSCNKFHGINTLCTLCNMSNTVPPELAGINFESISKLKYMELLHFVLCAGTDVGIAHQFLSEQYGVSEGRNTPFDLQGNASTVASCTSTCEPVVDEDEVVIVDFDDDTNFGASQFSERDLSPCPSTLEDADQSALREAVISNFNHDTNEDPIPVQVGELCGVSSFTESSTSNENESISVACRESIVNEALICKIKDLQEQLRNCAKCNICLEGYKEPLVSTACWHVCCKDCWMKTLGEKKLCPQCNKIALPANLRRIFL